jgi:hypothetical protein
LFRLLRNRLRLNECLRFFINNRQGEQ